MINLCEEISKVIQLINITRPDLKKELLKKNNNSELSKEFMDFIEKYKNKDINKEIDNYIKKTIT